MPIPTPSTAPAGTPTAYYRYNGFNYYGLPLYNIDKNRLAGLSTTTDQQTVQHYGFDTRIASKPNKEFNYTAEISYRGYNSDLGLFYGQRAYSKTTSAPDSTAVPPWATTTS